MKEWIEVNNMSEENYGKKKTEQRSRAWNLPPIGWVKYNFDSSFRNENEEIGVGWILRDENGHHILFGHARLSPVEKVFQAEAKGFVYAIQMMWIQGWRNVWFEGDNLDLVKLVNESEENTSLGSYIYEIKFWTLKLPNASLDHTNRETNEAIDCLAKKAIDNNNMSSCFPFPSKDIIKYLYQSYIA